MTFKPLLAAKTDEADLANLVFPLMWSPKLDGIRTMVTLDGHPVTRKLKLVPNERLRATLGVPELMGMDGEMIFGGVTDKDVFNRTQSKVMTIDGPCPYEAGGRYLVFDDFTDPYLPFAERFAILQRRVERLPAKLQQLVHVVPHKSIGNLDDLMNVERMVVGKGFEGVMGRNPEGRYKFGRSTLREGILFKIKRFADAEAELVGVEELFHNENELQKDELGHAKRSSHQENLVGGGTMGALVLYSKTYDGIEIALPNGKTAICDGRFKVGTGFSAAQRADIWARRDELLGKTVCFKFQPSGMKDLPRFPSFKGFRKD